MQVRFRKKNIVKWVSIALAVSPMAVIAAEPYPSLPPSLSTSVAPNILLYLDDSGSMNEVPYWQDSTGRWRSDETPDHPRKMSMAKKVIKSLLSKKENAELNWGLHTFDYRQGNELRTPIKNRADPVALKELKDEVDKVLPTGGTPLATTAYKTSLYWRGKASYRSGPAPSPIKYRCQKNFQIIITDGDPSGDTDLDSAIRDSDLAGFGITRPTGGGESSDNLARISEYMFKKDMRPAGTDEDGKDFNDPAFPIQNVATYTVAFNLQDTSKASILLKKTASVAGGKYYDADNEKELTDSLSNALASILSQRSNAGGVAVASKVKSNNNYAYQPVFNPDGWYGELSRYKINADGSIDKNTRIEAGALLNSRSPDSRIILSAKADKTTMPFAFTESNLALMSDAQKSLLGSSPAEQQKIIRYIRGAKDKDLRERKSLLGDFINTQPVFVGAPSSFSTESAFNSFKDAQKDRSMVFVGANDGMIHGFNATTMNEIGGYIPSMVYRNLKILSHPKYGAAGGIDAPHVYHVSGTAATADVKTSAGWKTYLVSGLGQGGQGYFALDVTSDKNFDNSSPKSAVKWELNDQHDAQMGYSFSMPVIWGVRDGGAVKPAVILANGYENDFDDTSSGGQKSVKAGALYIVDIETGKLIRKIEVAGSTGLSAPHGVDDLGDGVLDYVYAGDQEGKMWRFDLTDKDPKNFSVTDKPIFDTKGKPIIQKPMVIEVHGDKSASGSGSASPTFRGHLVLFGTGKLLTTADRKTTSTQSLYGVLDIGVLDKSAKTVTLGEGDLEEQKILPLTKENTTKEGTFRQVTDNPVDITVEQKPGSSTKKGWYINLTPTERQTATPQILGDKVIFGTGIMTSTKVCTPGGAGWMMVLDPFTGSTVRHRKSKYSFMDVNGDGNANGSDKINGEFVSGVELPGIPSEMTLVNDTDPFAGMVRDTTKPSNEPQMGDFVAAQGANTSAVSVVNSKKPPKETLNVKDCKGQVYIPSAGSDEVSRKKLDCPKLGVRVERTTWRELVQ
ncbi:pilus assembly protein [Chitinimonas sp. BJB300]|uniref:pilus assembly protein n=1 Tax=Chitinimonas sp. BJB300 TaxID=1559339 RepID=UPI0013042584|nr:PilC/PilY family type IV pilus protein [Chitinimonas sp. BJB300]